MIGSATIGAGLPATPAPTGSADSMASAASAATIDTPTQPANGTSAGQVSAPSAKAGSHAHDASRSQSTGDDARDFDRLLEPDAPTVAAGTASAAKPTTAGDAEHEPPTTAPTGTQAPSLADQVLGLLGLLTPATAGPAAAQADAAPPAAPAGTPKNAGAAMPGLALGQPASGPGLPGHAAAAASDTAHSGAAPTAAFTVDRALRDASTATGNDPSAIATRDPNPVSAAVPLPAPVERLPSVPQPALVQPANPDAGYGDDLGSSVVWMAEHRVGHASLQVSPDHLGPIEVRLQLEGARVHAEFYSAQPEVRHALEASLPRLRDLLGQHGLQLGQADVGQRQRNGTPHAPTGSGGQSDCFPDESRPLPTPLHRARGLVDEYA